MKKLIFIFILGGIIAVAYFASRPNPGDIVDEFNGVAVYYNGKSSNEFGRSLTADGYNLGKKYQCVEFIKRYYYEYFGHKMPDSFGHAKDYYNGRLKDGELNPQRGLVQYSNPSMTKPKVNDIIVMKGNYGHVGIVSYVTDNAIEMVQQNTQKPRRTMRLTRHEDGKWEIENSRILGWLRLEGASEDGEQPASDLAYYKGIDNDYY